MEQTILTIISQYGKEVSSILTILSLVLFLKFLSKFINLKNGNPTEKLQKEIQQIKENELNHFYYEIDDLKERISKLEEKLYNFEGRLSRLEAKINNVGKH